MDSELDSLLERLIDADVLVDVGDDNLELSNRFREERTTVDLSESVVEDARERFAATLGTDPVDLDDDLLVDALTVQTLDPDIQDRDTIVAANAISRFADEKVAEGVPDGFVPVRPSEIPTFLDQHPGAVLYFWSLDCEPCDEIEIELEGLTENDMVPDPLGRGAVYLGSDIDIEEEFVELIAEDYQVVVVPTLLFFRGQSVESRYVGPKNARAIRREMEILVEYLEGYEVEQMTLDECTATGNAEDVIDIDFEGGGDE